MRKSVWKQFPLGRCRVAGVRGMRAVSTFSKEGLWAGTLLFAGLALSAGWLVVLWIVRRGPSDFLFVLSCAAIALGMAMLFQAYLAVLRVKDRQGGDKRVLLNTVRAMTAAIEALDNPDHGHVSRVADYAFQLGRRHGLSRQELENLQMASYLHDIGKLVVPAHILHKGAPLTEAEREKACTHPAEGVRILARSGLPDSVLEAVHHHHERWDGRGYPDGLAGEQIPLPARILALATAYDALRTGRAYRQALDADKAHEILKQDSGSRFDPQLVEELLVIAAELDWGHREPDAPTADSRSPIPGPLIPQCPEPAPELLRQIADAGIESRALLDIASSLAKAVSLEEVLKAAVGEIRHHAPYASLVLYEMDPISSVITPHFVDGDNRDELQMLSVQWGQGVTGWAIANRRSMVVNHPELDFPAELHRIAAGYRSAAAFPLAQGDSARDPYHGALTLYFKEAYVFSPDSERRLQDLAARIGARVAELALLNSAQAAVLSDPVTKLPNQRYLYAHTSQELAKGRRHTYPVSIVEMEIENYQALVEEAGRAAVEDLLRDLARTLRHQLRDSDVLARLSETELAAVFSMTSHSQARFLIRRLQNTAAAFRYRTGPGILAQVRMSFGCAVFPDHGRTCESLFLRANSDRLESRRSPSTQVLPMGLRQVGSNIIPFQSL